MRETERREPHDTDFDVMIIGGGPAGLAAAVWCADLHLRAVLLDDGPRLGGQLGWTFNEIRNYPGIESISADDLRRRMAEQAASGSTVILAARVVKADLSSKSVEIVGGRVLRARAMIIATGVRRRRLGLRGEVELLGRGILHSGVGSRDETAGKHVVIVGGGDAAVENAVVLSETAALVTLVHRGERLSARREFVDAASSKGNVAIRLATRVDAIIGEQTFEGVELAQRRSCGTYRVDADHLLVRIGTEPNTELFAGQLDLDPQGYIRVTADTSTSVEGVFAIGDAAFPIAPTLSTAAGTGAIAAKAIAMAKTR